MRQNHDGIYAVDVVTRQGSCDRDYRWMIAVSGGRVSSPGDTPMEASGQISRRGMRATWRSSASGRSPRLPESSRGGQARAPGRQRRCNAPVHGGPQGKADRPEAVGVAEKMVVSRGPNTLRGYAGAREGALMSRVPDFSKLPFAPAPIQCERCPRAALANSRGHRRRAGLPRKRHCRARLPR